MRPRRSSGFWQTVATLGVSLVAIATAVPVAREIRAQDWVSAASGEGDYYCSLFVQLEAASNVGPDFDLHDNTEQFRIATELATAALPLVTAIRHAAPYPAAADMEVILEAVRKVARDGDFRLLGLRGGESLDAEANLSPQALQVRRSFALLHEFNAEHCRWNRYPVVATDFAFHGSLHHLEPGIASFEFANNGNEIHQMMVLRKSAGERQSLQQILDRYHASGSPDLQIINSKETVNLGLAFAPQGKTDHLVTDLTPGEYAMICLIPQGSVFISEMNEHTGAGPTHYRLGMATFFEVS